MRIKAIYRKNLKMSEGKVAAQIAHAVKGLFVYDETSSPDEILNCNIVVLGVSDKKFSEIVDNVYLLAKEGKGYIQVDKGLTEIEPNTRTAFAWIENE